MARSISENFIKELKDGILKPVLDYIHHDYTLDMELRGNEVTIYYRGGKLFSIKEEKKINNYIYELEPLAEEYGSKLSIDISNIEDYIPKAKHLIDKYSFEEKESWEREIQQQIVRENNYSPNAKDTDFFIIDIEYKDIGRAVEFTPLDRHH